MKLKSRETNVNRHRKSNPIRKLLHPSTVIFPMVIGLSVVCYMLFSNFNPSLFSKINWTWQSLIWLLIAVLMMLIRDFAYMYRIKLLSNGVFSWKQAIRVILLWEFASAATPSVVGGAPIAVFILNKEGINLGKSTAIVLVTSFLDELFYVTIVPVLFLLIQQNQLFPTAENLKILGTTLSTQSIFWTSYGLVAFYSLFIGYGLFFNPFLIKKTVQLLFSLPFLKKWKKGATTTGDEIIIAAQEIKNNSFLYWIKSFLATFISWTARYWVVNFLILSVVFTNQHLLIYAKQLVMWIIMLVSPTPGGSGIAEFAFTKYLAEFIPTGFASSLALVWRLISYYPYLIIGVILLPKWLQRVYLKRKLIKFKNN